MKFSQVFLSYSILFHCDCFFGRVFLENKKIAVGYFLGKSARKIIRREKVENFKPIRINTFYLDVGELSAEESSRLSKVVDAAAQKISTLLSVIPIKGKLLLTRTNVCSNYWAVGINIGRCSRFKPSYKGEFCLEELFSIPDDHLQGTNLFNSTSSEPLPDSIQDGRGISDCDLAVYVCAVSTQKCQSKDLVAYATHCQLDRHNNRPIAGYANVCPHHLQDGNFNFAKAVYVMVHELLHVAGFSAKLFPKYRICPSQGHDAKCLPKIFRVTDTGRTELVLPTLVEKMKAHFNCSHVDIGAPLQKTRRDGSMASSHWDPESVFYASVMAANLAPLDYISIDEFTLAALEDSGWYRVNYSSADPYPYGKGTGCGFIDGSCENAETLRWATCSHDTQTCDFLHRGKVTCRSNRCPIATSLANSKSCADADNSYLESWEKSGESSRCFALSYTNGTIGAACLLRRCHGSALQVEVDGVWNGCLPEAVIHFQPESSGQVVTITCPPPEILCGKPKWDPQRSPVVVIANDSVLNTSSTSTWTNSSPTKPRCNNTFQIYFTLLFILVSLNSSSSQFLV